jgi:phosphotransferase system HPr (HPr) family protein
MNGVPQKRWVLITNPNGLHMRPSVAFATLARNYQSNVVVTHDGRSVDGKSPLDMMTLGAEVGTKLLLEVDGPDAAEAIEALAAQLGSNPHAAPSGNGST